MKTKTRKTVMTSLLALGATFDSWGDAEYQMRVDSQRSQKDARREWKFPCWRSRGKRLIALDAKGERLEDPYENWRPGLGSFERMLARFHARHGDQLHEVIVDGGWDGAENVLDMNAGEYEPWAGSWSVTLWRKPHTTGFEIDTRHKDDILWKREVVAPGTVTTAA